MNNTSEQELLKQWILYGICPESVEWAKKFGKMLTTNDKERGGKEPLTTGQLRKFFGEVKRISSNVAENKEDIAMLKPLLAYAVGRDKNKQGKSKTKIEDLYERLSIGIDAVLKSENLSFAFGNFVKLFEAIVAYHKFYGGKELNN